MSHSSNPSMTARARARLLARWALPVSLAAVLCCCGGDEDRTPEIPVHPVCGKGPHTRQDAHTPRSRVADWGAPVRLGPGINTLCPEDAAEISRDGRALYFLFTEDLLDSLTPSETVSRPNATYRAERGDPGEDFDEPAFYDLDSGASAALDGAPSFSWDGTCVYFHSLRAANTGYGMDPPADDMLDIYAAPMVNGRPGAAVNLGPAVNSQWPDGEPTIAPGDSMLYFTSLRPGGPGGRDIWVSTRQAGVWSEAAPLGAPINSPANDTQPAFCASGDTIYFVSDRDGTVGSAIYRSVRAGDGWSGPEIVLEGIVGEPSLTADGSRLYFVHVLTDAEGLFDADIWYCERVRP